MVEASVIKRVDDRRLERAAEGLMSGAYEVSISYRGGEEVRGVVKKKIGRGYGGGAVWLPYQVALTPVGTSCSCPDALYRGTTFKHCVALALYVIGHPQERPQEGECDHNAPYVSVTGCQKCGSKYLHEGEPKPFPKLARVRSEAEMCA